MDWIQYPISNGVEPLNQCKTKSPSCGKYSVCSTFDPCTQNVGVCAIKFCSTKSFCDGYLCGFYFE